MINEELSKSGITQERAAYLRSVLAEITKALNFEDVASTPAISIKVINDPDQVKPATANSSLKTIGDGAPNPSNLQDNRKTISITSIESPTPVNNFASSLAKAEAIQAILVGGPTELKKSKLTDKFDEIKSMFKITEEDLKGDGYNLRWKIGDLISLLQNAIRLEELTGGDVSKEATTKAAKSPATKPAAWPRDMASAKFDEKAGVFKNEPGAWER